MPTMSLRKLVPVFALVGVLLLVAIGWRVYDVKRSNQAAQNAVRQLLKVLNAGEYAHAKQMLALDAVLGEVRLRSLGIALEASLLTLEAPLEVKRSLWSNRINVIVPLVTPAGTERLVFVVGGGGQIILLPPLLAHPGTVVLSVSEKNYRLWAYGAEAETEKSISLQAGQVGLAVVVGSRLLHFAPAELVPVGKLLRYSYNGPFETEYYVGALSRHASLVNFLGKSAPEPANRMLPGTPRIGVVIWRGEVYAAVSSEQFVPDSIRVVLGATNYTSLSHAKVELLGATDIWLEDRINGSIVRVPAKTGITIVASDQRVSALVQGAQVVSASHRLYIWSVDNGLTTINSIKRALGYPAYRGNLEISVAASGMGLNIINEVSLNEYLYSVVPSEMPVSYGLEALKAQALAARAYALTGILSGGYAHLAGHVEDSVMSQVYNNVAEHPVSSAAVEETADLVPVYEGSIVDARFFSTSCGYTANHHEVWSSGNEFPGVRIPYLVAQKQSPQAPEIINEKAVQAFLSRKDITSPDSHGAYFRWSVNLGKEELAAIIEANLAERLKAQPSFVKQSRGEPPAAKIGVLQDIVVHQRGEGGNIMELEIVGSNASYRVAKEYNIRALLRPVPGGPVMRLQLNNGATLSSFTLLPSAFIYFDIQRDAQGDIAAVTIRGGGNGHGVGMSQVGAWGLTRQGHNFRQIIAHYYPGSSIMHLRDYLTRSNNGASR